MLQRLIKSFVRPLKNILTCLVLPSYTVFMLSIEWSIWSNEECQAPCVENRVCSMQFILLSTER